MFIVLFLPFSFHFLYFSTEHFDVFLQKLFIYSYVDLYLSFVSCNISHHPPSVTDVMTSVASKLRSAPEPMGKNGSYLSIHPCPRAFRAAVFSRLVFPSFDYIYLLSPKNAQSLQFIVLLWIHFLYFFWHFNRIWGGPGDKSECPADHIEPKTEGITSQ